MLSGDFQNISLASFFQLIQLERKTLTLILSQGDFRKKIFFREGAIGFVFSNDPRDFLGHYLLSQGLVTEDDLIAAMRSQGANYQLLGKIFSKMTNLSEGAIRNLVAEKLKESVYALFFLEDLTFTSDEEVIDWGALPDIFDLNTQAILMEALKRVDEVKRLRKKIPNNGVGFEVLKTEIPGDYTSRKALQKVLNLIKEGKSIDALCLHFHTYDFKILKYLELLLERGFIRPVLQPPQAVSKQVSKPIENIQCKSLISLAESTAQSGNIEKAIEIYKDILRLHPSHPVARKNLEVFGTTIGSQKTARAIERQSVFEIGQMPSDAQVKLTPEEGFILSRINGKWTVEEILLVTPLSEERVLSGLTTLLETKLIRQVAHP